MTPAAFILAVDVATCPEDLFGAGTAEDVQRAYHRLALAIHPDGRPPGDRELAHRAFTLLGEWYELARARLADDTYGQRIQRALFTLRSKAGEHRAERLIAAGDVADVYAGTSTLGGEAHRSVVKVSRLARDADLMEAERRALKRLRADARGEALRAFYPYLDDDAYEEEYWPCPADGHDMINECGPGEQEWADGRRMCACHEEGDA